MTDRETERSFSVKILHPLFKYNFMYGRLIGNVWGEDRKEGVVNFVVILGRGNEYHSV